MKSVCKWTVICDIEHATDVYFSFIKHQTEQILLFHDLIKQFEQKCLGFGKKTDILSITKRFVDDPFDNVTYREFILW